MIRLNVDGKEIKAEEGKTVLEAALQAGIYIPNLCYHPDIPFMGACRLCIVEIKGMKELPTSCTTYAKDGMVIRTNTPRIRELRKKIMWLILSEHPEELDKSSQLKKVAERIGVKEVLPGYVPRSKNLPVISDDPLFVRDMNKCILCGRCVRICQELRETGVLGFVNRGIKTTVDTFNDLPLKDAGCKFCGACVEVCPSGSLADKEKFEEKDREKKLLPCKNTCPAEIDVARYVRLIAEGRFQDAIEVVRERVPFPHVLGLICHHPCEDECHRGEVNEPIAIKALKGFAASRDSGRWKSKITIAPETGKNVAIVGSGPAGLTAAWFLGKLGHSVTVFEELPEPGGMMRACIPEYRLPRNVLEKEIKDIEGIGVKIKTGTRIESLDGLFGQGFDAVFLGLGAMKGMKMGIPGEDDPRVMDGITVLSSISFGRKSDIKGKVAVVGGGNVAIDVARSMLRSGAKEVVILYRRSCEEMPADRTEVDEALNEGVKIDYLVTPQKISPGRDKLKLECIRMKLGEPDASGRRCPIPVEGSEFTVEVDRLVMATGQAPIIPEKFGLSENKKGCLIADKETLSCSRKGVFSGGDVVSGPASVIEAIRDGRKAAISIDRFLGGNGLIDQKFIPEEDESPCLGREEEFAYRTRCKITTLPVNKRLKGFSQVEHVLDKKTALKEAERCLRCQLRLKISRPPLPPK